MAAYIKWVDTRKGNPQIENKLIGGDEDGLTIFIARTKHNGNVYPGKYIDLGHPGAPRVDRMLTCLPDGKEKEFNQYQVATGDESNFKWIKQSGPFNKFNILALGFEPVQAGFEIVNDGYDLKYFYVARAPVVDNKINMIVPGKVAQGSVSEVVRGWKQHVSDEYEVLVYTGSLSGIPKPPSGFELPTLPSGIPKLPAGFEFPTLPSGIPKLPAGFEFPTLPSGIPKPPAGFEFPTLPTGIPGFGQS